MDCERLNPGWPYGEPLYGTAWCIERDWPVREVPRDFSDSPPMDPVSHALVSYSLNDLYGIIESSKPSSSSYTTVRFAPSPTTLLPVSSRYIPVDGEADRVLPHEKSSIDQNEYRGRKSE